MPVLISLLCCYLCHVHTLVIFKSKSSDIKKPFLRTDRRVYAVVVIVLLLNIIILCYL